MDGMVNAAPGSPPPSGPPAAPSVANNFLLKRLDPTPPHPSTADAVVQGDREQHRVLLVLGDGTHDDKPPTISTSNVKGADYYLHGNPVAKRPPGPDVEAPHQNHDTGDGDFRGSGTGGPPGPAGLLIDDRAQGHWHYSHRSPWLRALVLGANDGLVSISSLMLGVGAVKSDAKSMIVSGLAGLVAGAGSMAIGEFVSVFSQRDTELADIEKERQEHAKGPEAQANELEELTQIYVGRGLNYYLAKQVAEELSRVDVLKAHVRDELGIDVDALSNPLQAALASAMAFSLGGGVPLLAGAFILSYKIRIVVVAAVSSITLAAFGAVGARLGGAPMAKAALRVLLGGWLAMGLTFGILKLLGNAGI